MNGVLSRALRAKQKLDLIYVDSDGQVSQRVIRVLELREDEILAYCYTRRRVRTFKKANVLSLYPYQRRKRMEA